MSKYPKKCDLPECSEDITSAAKDAHHFGEHITETRPDTCPLCGGKFGEKLRELLRDVGCDRSKLKTGIKSHWTAKHKNKENKQSCPHGCKEKDGSLKLFTLPTLRRHKKEKHGEGETETFTCQKCGKTFPRQYALAYHQKVHQESQSIRPSENMFEKPFKYDKQALGGAYVYDPEHEYIVSNAKGKSPENDGKRKKNKKAAEKGEKDEADQKRAAEKEKEKKKKEEAEQRKKEDEAEEKRKEGLRKKVAAEVDAEFKAVLDEKRKKRREAEAAKAGGSSNQSRRDRSKSPPHSDSAKRSKNEESSRHGVGSSRHGGHGAHGAHGGHTR